MKVVKSFQINCAIALVAFLLAGCGSDDDDGGKTTGPDAAMIAALSIVDEADGTADKVVTRCITCSLGMDGKPEYTVTVHGYDFHLCKEGCRRSFESDADRIITMMAKKK